MGFAYPRAVPLLTELMNAYRETGQDERRLEVMRRLRDIEPRPVPEFMWDEQPPVKVWLTNVEAWCAKIERLVNERRMDPIHLQHIQNVLHVSCGNATMVCDALQNRGVLGPYDMATGRHWVLIGKAQLHLHRVYSSKFLDSVRIASTGTVKKAVKRLADDELVYEWNRTWRFVDPFFREWVNRKI